METAADQLAGSIHDVLLSPLAGITRVTRDRRVAWALLIVAAAWTVAVATFILDMGEVLFGIGREWNSIVLLLFTLLFCVGLVLLNILVSSGITHLIAIMFRGQGAYSGMLCGRSFANLPLVFFAPLAVLHIFLSYPGSLIYYLGAALIFVWVLLLDVMAVRQNYRFSTARAIATYAVFAVALLGLMIVPSIIVAAISFFG